MEETQEDEGDEDDDDDDDEDDDAKRESHQAVSCLAPATGTGVAGSFSLGRPSLVLGNLCGKGVPATRFSTTGPSSKALG
jgi:hypothetical protein